MRRRRRARRRRRRRRRRRQRRSLGDGHHEWSHNRHFHCASENICIPRRRIASHRIAPPRQARESERWSAVQAPISLSVSLSHVTLQLQPEDEKCIKSFRTIRTGWTAREGGREGRGAGGGRAEAAVFSLGSSPRLASFSSLSLPILYAFVISFLFSSNGFRFVFRFLKTIMQP